MNLKIKLKRFISFAIIATASCFYSCQEDFEENIMPYNKHIIKDISFKQASKIAKFAKANNKFMEEISSIKNDKNKSTSRFSDSGFAVDSSTVREITVGDYTSYTMSILKDEPNQAYFENLVIEINGNKLTEYLFRYTPSAITQIADHDSYIFNGEMNMVWHGQTTMFGPDGVLNDSNNNDGPGQTLNCLSVLLCNGTLTGGTGPVHIANPNCTKTFSVMQCTGGGGNIPFINYNFNSSSNNQTSSQSGGSGSSNSPPTVITVPFIPCPTCPEIPLVDPCEKITAASNATNYKLKFKELNKPEKFNAPQESGFARVVNNFGATYNQDLLAIGNSSLKPPRNAINFTHVHNKQPQTDPDTGLIYDGGVKMLSPADISSAYIMSFKAESLNLPTTEAFGTMISSDGIFSLVVLDNNFTYTTEEYEEFNGKYFKASEKIINKYKFNTNSNVVTLRKKELEIMLLTLLNNSVFKDKLQLLEGSVKTSPDGSINISWNKKSINNLGVVEETPC